MGYHKSSAHPIMAKALFLLKRREDYSQDASYSSSNQIATGMWNSSKFVVDALQEVGIDAVVEVVVDANSIDAVCVCSTIPILCLLKVFGLYQLSS